MNYEFVDDIATNKHFRLELRKLIENEKRELTLDHWMLKGHHDPEYKYLGIIDQKQKLIGIIGFMKTRLFFRGEKYTALQFGNYFFSSKIKNSEKEQFSLEQQLLSKLVDKFETIVDFLYTYQSISYANTMNELGFKKVEEHQYFANINKVSSKKVFSRQLNLDNREEREKLYLFLKHSHALSRDGIDFSQDATVKMYNILKYYSNNVYEIPNLETIVVVESKDDYCLIIGVFSKHKINFFEILQAIVLPETKIVEFCFNPVAQLSGINFEIKTKSSRYPNSLINSQLYVKTKSLNFNDEVVVLPLLSRQK